MCKCDEAESLPHVMSNEIFELKFDNIYCQLAICKICGKRWHQEGLTSSRPPVKVSTSKSLLLKFLFFI